MLIIRDAQCETLRAAKQREFEERMVDYLRRFFPGRCLQMGVEGVREAIHHGVTRGFSYGITTERDVSKYLTLVFAFGRDFDEDPRLPWASEILKDPRPRTGTARMARLYAAAKTHAEAMTASRTERGIR